MATVVSIHVSDASLTPVGSLPGALVAVTGTNSQSAISDGLGMTQFNLPVGNYSVTVSKMGYSTRSFTFSIAVPDPAGLPFDVDLTTSHGGGGGHRPPIVQPLVIPPPQGLAIDPGVAIVGGLILVGIILAFGGKGRKR